jgi:hypothetical protein
LMLSVTLWNHLRKSPPMENTDFLNLLWPKQNYVNGAFSLFEELSFMIDPIEIDRVIKVSGFFSSLVHIKTFWFTHISIPVK